VELLEPPPLELSEPPDDEPGLPDGLLELLGSPDGLDPPLEPPPPPSMSSIRRSRFSRDSSILSASRVIISPLPQAMMIATAAAAASPSDSGLVSLSFLCIKYLEGMQYTVNIYY